MTKTSVSSFILSLQLLVHVPLIFFAFVPSSSAVRNLFSLRPRRRLFPSVLRAFDHRQQRSFSRFHARPPNLRVPSRYHSTEVSACPTRDCYSEGVRVVVGDEAPLGGVAQVIFHGVRVVEVGLQVREHKDRREEEDGEGQVEVEREVEENQRQQHICDMRMT